MLTRLAPAGVTLAPGGVALAVADSYAAYPGPLYPPEAILPGTTLQENSDRIFVAGGGRTSTIKQSSDSLGTWRIEYFAGLYIQNYGAYATGNGEGGEFVVYSPAGCFVQMRGGANANGGDFDIKLDGQSVRTGNCYAPGNSQKDYHTPIQVPAGTHVITTAKLSGAAHYWDEVQVYT